MKPSLGFKTEASNINKVIINQTPGAYNLEISMEVLTVASTSVNRRLTKSTFILASTDTTITRQILEKDINIIPYLSRQKTSSAIAFNISSLGFRIGSHSAKQTFFKNPKKGIIKNLIIQKDNILNLTIFAGTISTRTLRRGQTLYSLVSIDTLKVLENGGPVENNLLLFEDEKKKKLWIGAAFQDNQGRWYKKIPGPITENSRLYTEIVPNTKVIFQSELNKNLLKTVANNFNDLFEMNKQLNSKQAIINKLKTETRNYFSSLYIAKNSNGDVPLSFSFNKLDFFRNNGAFSKLIKNENEMISSFDLLSGRIMRKRIIRNNPTNRLTGAGPAKEFDGQESIISSPITYPNLLSTNNVLTVATTDTEMKEITD